MSKKEGHVGSVNITGAREEDSRKAMNHRTLGTGTQKDAKGLLNRGSNNDYYRRVLNAL
jgi:hypothetical protein